jgi:predicted small lipoprotein YifL
VKTFHLMPMLMRVPILIAAALLAACGQKGPLYLPDEARDIVTRPAQTPATPAGETEAPNSPQTIDSPPGTPSPAPEVVAPDEEEKRKQQGAPAP